MHVVGSLTWRIIISLTFMSHLYKEFWCKSIFHKTDKGLEQTITENQLREMRIENTERNELNQLRLHHTSKHNLSFLSHENNTGNSGIVRDDDPESKQVSKTAMVQMKKEEILQDMRSDRLRRHSSGEEEASQDCTRHEIYVNFATLGWNTWLVAPNVLNLYYCAGKCERPLTDLSSNNYSTILGIMSESYPSIPKPCCVPTKMSTINAITNLNNNVKVHNWTNMIIDECGCL